MRTSARATDNEALEADLRRLEAIGYVIDVLVETPHVGIVVHDVPLPPGYSKEKTRVLLLTTDLYPASAMDMFWVDVDVTLSGGAIPSAAESIEHLFGEPWRRYSWHRNTDWRPGRDDLVGHFEFAQARLQRPQ